MNVRDHVSAAWLTKLHKEVLDCPEDSVVGRLVLHYILAVNVVLALTEETDEHNAIEDAAIRQINVWYFG